MSCQYMSNRLVEVIQELWDYLKPEAHGPSDEDVVHRVMCQALDFQRQLSELNPKGSPRRASLAVANWITSGARGPWPLWGLNLRFRLRIGDYGQHNMRSVIGIPI